LRDIFFFFELLFELFGFLDSCMFVISGEDISVVERDSIGTESTQIKRDSQKYLKTCIIYLIDLKKHTNHTYLLFRCEDFNKLEK